jgi:hypothetical protein
MAPLTFQVEAEITPLPSCFQPRDGLSCPCGADLTRAYGYRIALTGPAGVAIPTFILCAGCTADLYEI